MKRLFAIFLLAVLLLTGCADEKPQQSQEPYTEVRNGVSYYVNPVAMTITANGHQFHYKYFDNDTEYGVSITYPNGAVIRKNHESEGSITVSSVGWSNADAAFIISNGGDYADGYDLLDVVPAQIREEEKGELIYLIFFGVACIGIGAWMCAQPHIHWYLTRGWRYKNAEPSDMALGVIVASGIIEIILGIILILIGIFS